MYTKLSELRRYNETEEMEGKHNLKKKKKTEKRNQISEIGHSQ